VSFRHRVRDKRIFRQLVDALGSRCRLTLSNGDEVVGVLASFRWSPLILCVDGSSRVFVNFRYVLKLVLDVGVRLHDSEWQR
jgi:hypothetical protein